MRGQLADTYLTDCELTVLRFLAAGHSNKDIASLMGASVRTTEKHRQELFLKLRCCSAVQLVVRAFELGLMDVEVRPTETQMSGSRSRHLIPPTVPQRAFPYKISQ